MKTSLAIAVLSLLLTPVAFANNKCLAEAKIQARIYSAENNNIPVTATRVTDSFFVEEADGVLYYGIRLDSLEKINVGLSKKDCRLALTPNYVTDGL